MNNTTFTLRLRVTVACAAALAGVLFANVAIAATHEESAQPPSPTTDVRAQTKPQSAPGIRAQDVRVKTQEKKAEVRTNVQEKRAEVKEKLGDKKEARQEKRAEVGQRLEKKQAERIKNYVGHVIQRLEAAITRLTRIADRLEERIVKLEAAKLDLSEARKLLAVARTEIESARQVIAGIPAVVEAMASSDTPKDNFNQVREIINGATASLKNAHRAVVQAIAATKAKGGVRADSDNGQVPATTNSGDSNQ